MPRTDPQLLDAWATARTVAPVAPPPAPPAKPQAHAPTEEMLAIYDWALNPSKGHGVVLARAGTGKTSGAICGTVSRIPSHKRVLCVAFNKPIAVELSKKGFGPNVFVSTLHSFSLRMLTKHLPSRPDVNGGKSYDVLQRIMFGDRPRTHWSHEERQQYNAVSYPLTRVISVMKNLGLGVLAPLPTAEDVSSIAQTFDIELPDGPDLDLMTKLTPQVYEASLEDVKVIDYDDMLLLPLKLKARFYTHDYVIVDEAQDLNLVQIEIIKRALAPAGKGRAMFVGDDHQAIYFFRGANANAFDSLISDFKSDVLPLTICWRCPRKALELAQKIVPDIRPRPNAPDGLVSKISEDQFLPSVKDGDFVLCRFTAPLIGNCLSLIAQGRKAIVRGRDIGKNLITLLGKIEKRTEGKTAYPDEAIVDYMELEMNRLSDDPRNESKRQQLQDKRDALLAIAASVTEGITGEGAFGVIRNKIEEIFSDAVEGIVFSTIHRVKGLEANRVFILLPHVLGKSRPGASPEQMQQEKNLEYVAYTRTQAELYLVRSSSK